MIILDTTTRKLEVILGGAITTNQLSFVASYVDITSTSFTPLSNTGATNNTTAVTLVDVPAASTQRQLKFLSIYNTDTVAATVTVRFNDNATIRKIFVITLAVGDTLVFADSSGWAVINASGQIKTGGGGNVSDLATTATNDNAAAGRLGEYIEGVLASGSATSLTSSTPKTIISISLTAGDWDVWGIVVYVPTTTTSVTRFVQGINTVDNTMANSTALVQTAQVIGSASFGPSYNTQTVRLSLATTTTVYLVGFSTFTASTMAAYGNIAARRVR